MESRAFFLPQQLALDAARMHLNLEPFPDGFGQLLRGQGRICGSLLGNELYRKTPVRYLAALGGRRWLPCAWQFTGFWKDQMDLARKTGAGVGVSNGWIEYTGLHRLQPNQRARLTRDIRTLGAGGVLTRP